MVAAGPARGQIAIADSPVAAGQDRLEIRIFAGADCGVANAENVDIALQRSACIHIAVGYNKGGPGQGFHW